MYGERSQFRPFSRTLWVRSKICPTVLGPILLILYIADLIDLGEKCGLHPHLYADDTQIYGFCSPDDTQALQNRVTVCISDVDKWMSSNRLQLNAAKTEVLWCASNRRQHFIPSASIFWLRRYCQVCKVCSRSGNISGQRHVHEDSRVADCIQLFCSSATDIRSIRRSVSQHSASFTLSVSLSLSSPGWCCRA